MNSINSLFLRQSYLDAWDDYKRSLSYADFPAWDYVVLTASNEAQAEAYRQQLEARRKKQFLSQKVEYVVLPDPAGHRVGSGGATLNVLRYVRSRADTFVGKRILVIHSGGDSKRVPQYSACGKLFSPVPRELPNGRRSTLFDEILIGMSGVPSRIKEGMLILSGDVLLLFNPLQIDAPTSGAAAISFKEDVDVGKNHGVFHMDEKGNVGEFLHKQTVEVLTSYGAVNDQGKVDIDTGAVLFSVDMLDDLHALVDTPSKFETFVNERARLSLYGDFLYPLASHSSLEQFYKEKPEGSFTQELYDCRTELWDTLSKYRLRLLRLAPAAFIHFGTSHELQKLMTCEVDQFSFLDWKRCVSGDEAEHYALNNSVIAKECIIGKDCYIEDSYVKGASGISGGTVLSHVTVCDRKVPPNVILHGLKLNDGRFVVRIYGVNDNPKESRIFGGGLEKFGNLWKSLWEAEIYPVCVTISEAVDAALNVYAIAQGEGNIGVWKNHERMSLCSSFNAADTKAILEWETHLRKTVKVGKLLALIHRGGTVEDAIKIFQGATISEYQLRILEEQAEQADSSTRLRIFFYLGKIMADTRSGEEYIQRAFREIRNVVLSGASGIGNKKTLAKPRRDEIMVRLPLRVNWGGGWSDTSPYCNENGGTVLNAAILLNHNYPVEVQVKRLPEKKIVFESGDLGTYGEFDAIADLQDCHNPFDPFALHKAALIACGIISREGTLSAILDEIGGLYLSTRVHNVPKGSGLGTSSVLAGACVKALFEYFAVPYTEVDLYDHVMCMEQIMSTGGGWQDQVGGLTPGIKYITSTPGARQSLCVRQIELSSAVKEELGERYALIYTGQRRLARNLLRDVVGRYIGNSPDSLFAIEEVQRLAVMMTFELERGNIGGFAKLLNDHWALSKMIDAGSTNTCIDQIFLAVDDLIDGKMICGAGGGGFLQVVLKKGVAKANLRDRLREMFQDCGVDVWEADLLY